MTNPSHEQIKANFKAGDVIYYQPQLGFSYDDTCRGYTDTAFIAEKLSTIYLKIDAITDRAIYFDAEWMRYSLMNGGLNHNLLQNNEKLNLFNDEVSYCSLEWNTNDDIVEYKNSSIVIRKSNKRNTKMNFFKYDAADSSRAIQKQLEYEIESLISTIKQDETAYTEMLNEQAKLFKFDFNKAIKNGSIPEAKDNLEIICYNKKELNNKKHKLNLLKSKLTLLECKLLEFRN